jgi:acetolactate synthase-1/2/3 large subunit
VPAGPVVDAGVVAEAAGLIAKARRPIIVVGGGALGVSAEVTALAEETGAPVYAYRMGRGVMDDRNPLSLTLPAARHYWAECDLVVGIGTRLQGPVQGWGTDDAMRFVRIEVDPEEMTRIVRPDVPILARAEEAVPMLRAELARIGAAPADTAEAVAAARDTGAHEMAVLEPQLSFLAAIRAALGEEGVLIDDLTQVGYVSRFGYPTYRPRTYLCSGYQGTLGSGFATALGAQHARPDLPMVSINGDGGFLFAVGELATAAHHGIPLVTVVFDDGAYGNVKRMQQDLYGGREIATDLTNPDFAALGRAFGVATERADSPEALRGALERLLARREPGLVHVPVGPMPDPFRFLMAPRVRG